jgi:hypothetical protein
VSDQTSEDGSAPPRPQESAGAFDWLVESHRQSAPLKPLADEAPAVVPPISFGFPEPQAPPAPPVAAQRPTFLFEAPPPPAPSSFPLTFTETPLEDVVPDAQPVFPPQPAFPPPQQAFPEPVSAFPAPQPVFPPPAEVFPPPQSAFPAPSPGFAEQQPVIIEPEPVVPVAAASVVPPTVIVVPAPTVPEPIVPGQTFPGPAAATGSLAPDTPTYGAPPPTPPAAAAAAEAGGAFGLERRQSRPRSANGPLDWVAFVLAFLAPPVGLLLGIGAVVTEPRTKGFVTGLAKAAIGIGAALSLVLGVGLVVYAKVSHDQAAHDAIVASSRGYCSALKSNPATLTSDTFGWPSPGDTIPASITSMKQYEARWDSLVKLAPAGIRADTQKIATTAKSIAAGVVSTQTLDDASDVAQMQNAVATTGINAWVTNYCD